MWAFKGSERIVVSGVNDQPLTFWRLGNRPIRVPAGKTRVNITAANEPYWFEDLRFHVKANGEYQISIDQGDQSLKVYEINGKKNKRIVARSKRIDQDAYNKQMIRWAP